MPVHLKHLRVMLSQNGAPIIVHCHKRRYGGAP